ncbi:MAG: hypothetical protein CHKLHMKO_00465 [Candidatus Argoarchaeum ethanivorans]|uniref:Transcription regulator AsnC/Lrp ligand binding domain-containing protein n=1 Tax=Candidatus Argoarchaeum ethanivorans TaxID=2608793 RepID=A0A811T7V6_9EURY|nr:MAG: hypothetical protein CHKLHMKO_00465 [Candidatus Argoarchaeum ethanivorans]
MDELTTFVYDLWRYGLYQTTTYIVKEKFHKLNKEGTQKAAFIFIRSLPDYRLNIIDEISGLDCVDEVSAVFGDQDIIVEVNEGSKNEIYPKIVKELRLLDDITSSETLITVYP